MTVTAFTRGSHTYSEKATLMPEQLLSMINWLFSQAMYSTVYRNARDAETKEKIRRVDAEEYLAIHLGPYDTGKNTKDHDLM